MRNATKTKPKVDPIERLDVRPLLDLVRDVRTAQLASPEGDAETRRLTDQLDTWLVDLGYPPRLPGIVLFRVEVDN